MLNFAFIFDLEDNNFESPDFCTASDLALFSVYLVLRAHTHPLYTLTRTTVKNRSTKFSENLVLCVKVSGGKRLKIHHPAGMQYFYLFFCP